MRLFLQITAFFLALFLGYAGLILIEVLPSQADPLELFGWGFQNWIGYLMILAGIIVPLAIIWPRKKEVP